MLNKLTNLIVIDWGFTRLKFWSIDHMGKIINEKNILIKDINQNPEFYNFEKLRNVANEILSFIRCTTKEKNKEIYILSSCQMHCISGIFSDNTPFLSSWNDMPIITNKPKIKTINGQPTLPSMPLNKIIKINGSSYLKTESTINLLQKQEIKIKCFLTPIQLIFNYFFNFNLPPSIPFWESTCLPKNLISKNNNFFDADLLNYPLHNKKILSKNKLKIFPEIGDLQASTYNALINSDMVINWGTGSQIIFKKSFKSIEIDYYRNFPLLGKVFVISHIPCGRLFSDYCKNKNINFEDLKESFNSYKVKNFKRKLSNIKRNILYFPGYDAFKLKYISVPEINISQIENYSIDQLITLWLFQYINLINYIFPKNKNIKKVNISICGELGGISIKAIKILEEICSSNFTFTLKKNSLPKSILQLSGIH